eukprot:TRINITY_DN9485_c0_g2_i1.p1 TRINITY_DN9485_c0_g2~~TRINITY_DN9485_c0_g2_i1.p1  ORF type:complete len:337 (+),score=48.50 TRINITY_DN9485_c0_g2_i1:226-1236(+)
MVLMNSATYGDSLISEVHFLPVAHVSFVDGLAMKGYIRSSKRPTVQISPVMATYGSEAPVVAVFSSAGPSFSPLDRSGKNDVLKPDISAPGVSILAPFSSFQTPQSLQQLSFNSLTGSSMAAPHVAGLAAMLKQLHPKWSPFAIKSALMTTASRTNNKGTPIHAARRKKFFVANPFDYGSGHVNPKGAADPGLVYDETYENFMRFLAGIDPVATLTNLNYQGNVVIRSYNLNLPNIAVSNLRTGRSVLVTRRVTNVAAAVSTYHATFAAPPGVKVVVNPEHFVISPGAVFGYTVNISVTNLPTNGNQVRGFLFGQLTWSDGVHSVVSVIAVQPRTK